MPDLSFRAEEVTAVSPAAVPSLSVRVAVSNAVAGESLRSIGLNCQVRIQTLGRSYSALEEARLLELFGERERWARTMTPMLWTSTSVNVPAFDSQTTFDLSLPCTLDFDVAAAKYFYGLEAGEVGVSVLFSGTVFYTAGGGLQIAQIPWDREARFALPVKVWQQAIGQHYGETAWLRLPKASFDRLYRFRIARGVAGWDRLLDRLMDEAEHAELRERTAAAAGATR